MRPLQFVLNGGLIRAELARNSCQIVTQFRVNCRQREIIWKKK